MQAGGAQRRTLATAVCADPNTGDRDGGCKNIVVLLLVCWLQHGSLVVVVIPEPSGGLVSGVTAKKAERIL